MVRVFKSGIYRTQCELFLSKPGHPSLQTVIFFLCPPSLHNVKRQQLICFCHFPGEQVINILEQEAGEKGNPLRHLHPAGAASGRRYHQRLKPHPEDNHILPLLFCEMCVRRCHHCSVATALVL